MEESVEYSTGDREQITLTVDPGINELMMELSGGERKRGQWLSDTVRSLASGQAAQGTGILEAINGRLSAIEGRLAAIERAVQ